ncbi:ATP synthase subunit b [Pirellulimonas nuda]|uniref:ATP synthase subunit b n=1 Tax=Pirellulimonas nuda TaxID=2528009 RepID=A0A518DAW2_9BACT|nr:F0F1 ATP synthase subunit B [Pirellulimonas nuda]QDU88624.1 ATP synthase subunit b [Pirellulimonas nuda]
MSLLRYRFGLPKAWALPATLAVALVAAVVAPASTALADENPADEGLISQELSTGETPPNPLTFDPDLALWTAAVFFVMLAVLTKFAWKPILAALKAREDGIAGDIASALQKHEEAKRVLIEHEAKLAGAAQQVREMLDEARRDAEATKSSIVAEATAAAKAERDRGVREIDQARDSAIKQMAEHSANLAIDLAARVVRQDISQDRQTEIVREAMGSFTANSPSNN